MSRYVVLSLRRLGQRARLTTFASDGRGRRQPLLYTSLPVNRFGFSPGRVQVPPYTQAGDVDVLLLLHRLVWVGAGRDKGKGE